MLSYRVNLMFRLQKMCQLMAMIQKWLSKNEAAIVDREDKSDIWKLFGAVEREEKVISNFVAYNWHARRFMLLSPSMELNRLESTTAEKIGLCGYTLTRGYTRPDHW